MLKFLVTGAAGQLGKDVVRELENRGYEVTGSGSKKRKTTGRYVKMDITDRNEVEAVMKKLRPDIVIHCAAWTAVDAAEEPENYEKYGKLMERAQQILHPPARKFMLKWFISVQTMCLVDRGADRGNRIVRSFRR